ncbi:HEPN domain-containing protein [Fructilactobacillus myrtifloralis]|uniref:HEPN domain-containing protein n=1 Tax=Fructilactobacillus myrtifloralis TaxID=2940301 RepID=A0ABY5BRQ6_9LACO|nr:HEPN domain-containing protein [Fructilactobacillus myrtifloralis]USS85748.1 HEPN domain-containing protein [Fructilactobacillus myrtifloralis]
MKKKNDNLDKAIKDFVKSINLNPDEVINVLYGKFNFSYSGDKMSNLLSEIVKNEKYKNIFFEPRLEHKLTEYIETKFIEKSDSTDKPQTSNEDIEDIIYSFLNQDKTTFIVLLPISGIYIINDELNLGILKIYNSCQQQKIFNQIKEQYNIQSFTEESTREFPKTKPFVILNIKSIDNSTDNDDGYYAILAAKRIISGILNATQIMVYGQPYRIELANSEIDFPTSPIVIKPKDKKIIVHFGEYEPPLLNEKYLSRTVNLEENKTFFSIINLIAKKIKKNEPLTNFESDLWKANEHIGNGIKEQESEKKLTNFMMGIESLVEIKSKHITEQIAITTAVIYLGPEGIKNKKNRNKFIKDFKNLYNLRSKISHGGTGIISKNDLNLLGFISIVILKSLSDHYNELKNESSIKKPKLISYAKSKVPDLIQYFK